MMGLQQAQEQLCAMGCKLITSGLTAGTWGNLSLRVDACNVAITPSGRDYSTLQPRDIPCVDLQSGAYQGPKPSSECQLHLAVYRQRREINAIIHTHATNASVVAAARREVPPILDDLVQLAGPTVRCAAYALPGTGRMARATLKALRGRNAALLANHGAVCLGRNLEEAFTCCLVLEKGCKAFIEAEFLGGAKAINRFEATLMHQYYLRKYSKRKDKSMSIVKKLTNMTIFLDS